MAKPIYVLGTGLSHNGSAVLLKDGRVVCGIEKERITRIKRDGQNDTAAVRYCLDSEGIELDDLELVVQCANFEVPSAGSFCGSRLFEDFDPERFLSISHHLAHAYSAAGLAPFRTGNVLVVDGCGSPIDQCVDLDSGASVFGSEENGHLLEKDSFYRFDGQKIIPLWKDFSPFSASDRSETINLPTTKHSLGGFYAAISEYCLGDLNAAGKLMGLAPYGNAETIKGDAFFWEDDRVFVDSGWQEKLSHPFTETAKFESNFQHYADVAAWAQSQLEKALLSLIRKRLKQFPHPNLSYTGGVALNAVANRRILREGLVDQFFVEPAAGDHGIALGCAFYGWLEHLQRPRLPHTGSHCFGRVYSADEIRSVVAEVPGVDWVEFDDEAALLSATADLLSDGHVIGWFQEGCEFGPRALGRRSILATPFQEGVRDHINHHIKFREDFRPFAPAALKKDARIYFEEGWDSPHMILVDLVRPEWREQLSEVSHLDGSARVQTVTPDWNRRFHGLLEHVKRATGHGLLLNTSFNKRGMPIMETPGDAIALFKDCQLDTLVIGMNILTKNEPIAMGVRSK